MMQVPLTRRDFLRRSLVVGGAVIFAPGLLTACGGGGGGSGSRSLRHSNWPTYIDEESVRLFREETGIDLDYIEDINDNGELFAKIQPDLSAGRNPGADIITPTYWMAGRLIGLGFVEELPLDQIPNAKNLVADLRNPSWDPEGRYSLPWQSGMTGVAYNIAATGKELQSTNDLFDPAYKGKVGMLTEMRDTLGLVLLGLGKDPATITFDGAAEAFDKIEKAKVDGQIRQFTGNDYMDDLAAGNFVAAVGWSGDISQLALDNPDLRFVIPEEGGMRWSDVMVIAAKAPNIADAAAWMNYVYDPVNAARIAASVGFNSPVGGVREQMRANPETAALGDSLLMFPDEESLSRLVVFKNLGEEEEGLFEGRFSAIVGA